VLVLQAGEHGRTQHCLYIAKNPCSAMLRTTRRSLFAFLTGCSVPSQLMLAVEHCHRKQVANRDIKLDNILLQANNNPNGRPLLKLCGAPRALVERGGACATIADRCVPTHSPE